MGFTHYFTYSEIPPDLFTALARDVDVIVEHAKLHGIEVAPMTAEGEPPVPIADDLVIGLNGVPGEECEDFFLTGVPTSSFTKTNRQPYDLVVAAVLVRAGQLWGDRLTYTSDDGVLGYLDGHRLLAEVFGPSNPSFAIAFPGVS